MHTPLAALPEVFATWSVAKSGQITSGVTSVIGDHAVTLTVAFFPLALVGLPVSNFPLFVTVLSFVGLVGILYAAFIYLGSKNSGHGFKRWQVYTLGAVLIVYVGVIVFGVLQVFSGKPSIGANHFKTFNRDGNEYLEHKEFFGVVDKMGDSRNCNQDNTKYLYEDEWQNGMSENLSDPKLDRWKNLGIGNMDGNNQSLWKNIRKVLTS